MCWEQMLTGTDSMDVLVKNWSNLISLIIGSHVLMTSMRVSEKYCPWVDKDLKKLMQTRDKLKKVATKRKSPFLIDSYQQVRNKVNVLNTIRKKQSHAYKISACQGNMKESWKTTNGLRNKTSKLSSIYSLKGQVQKLFTKKISQIQ